MKDEKRWYRCTSREEMIILITNGFNYTNFRPDKYNDGNVVFYFERNDDLNEFLSERSGEVFIKM